MQHASTSAHPNRVHAFLRTHATKPTPRFDQLHSFRQSNTLCLPSAEYSTHAAHVRQARGAPLDGCHVSALQQSEHDGLTVKRHRYQPQPEGPRVAATLQP